MKRFVDEMRAVTMELHTKDQEEEGEKEKVGPPISTWDPSVDGYLKFIVDSKIVFDTLELIVSEASHISSFPSRLSPVPHTVNYLQQLAKKDAPAFKCHFNNIYFAHTAGDRIIGRKVAEKILDKKVLEFYKREGSVPQLSQNVRMKLDHVSSGWSREEKNHRPEETEKSFVYSKEILRLILS